MGQRIEMPWGYVEFGNEHYRNEVIIVTTAEDPPMVRMASKTNNFGGMVWSRLRSDGLHETLGILQGKQDERYRSDPNNLAGEVTLHLRQPKADNDAAQVHVLTARSDGVTFHVPITGGQPAQNILRSDDGRFTLDLQGDGNLVLYGPNDAVLWATMTVQP